MIDEKLLIEELNFRGRTPRSTMEIIRDIIPLVEMQPKASEQEIRNKVIEDYKTKLIDRYEHSKSVDEKFAYLDLDDVTEIAEQMKEAGE